MQTIITKYVGATNTKPSRIVAVNSGKTHRVVLSYDHALDIDGNHAQACRVLRAKLGWTKAHGYTNMHGGSHSDGSMVWVFYDPYHVCDN